MDPNCLRDLCNAQRSRWALSFFATMYVAQSGDAYAASAAPKSLGVVLPIRPDDLMKPKAAHPS